MKFTMDQLLAALEELKAMAVEAYQDEIGDELEDPMEFLKNFAEIVQRFKEEAITDAVAVVSADIWENKNRRLQAFNELQNHPWLGKGYSKLTPVEIAIAKTFILTNANLDTTEFERQVNRLFLDGAKPTHASTITELLLCANTKGKK